jgi:flagellin
VDRVEIQKEIDQIKKGINEIANNTEFNTRKLLNIDGPKIVEVSTEIEAMFGTILGADWPDMNIISPTGYVFGYGGTMGGGSPQTI